MSQTLLGFDYGTRRIGIAVGSSVSGTAQPLTTIHHRDAPDWPAITHLVSEWGPGALVVGLPLTEDGSAQAVTGQAQSFMTELARQFALPVYAVDERFSSLEAQARLRAGGTGARRSADVDVDAVSAQVILETYFAGATV